jgi:hypothetical protein
MINRRANLATPINGKIVNSKLMNNEKNFENPMKLSGGWWPWILFSVIPAL